MPPFKVGRTAVIILILYMGKPALKVSDLGPESKLSAPSYSALFVTCTRSPVWDTQVTVAKPWQIYY